MARPLRIEYSDALYHVMARGDGGKAIFETEEDALSFLNLLGQNCERCGWRVHAWVLMGNHYHLMLETPQPNLVTGMKCPGSVLALQHIGQRLSDSLSERIESYSIKCLLALSPSEPVP